MADGQHVPYDGHVIYWDTSSLIASSEYRIRVTSFSEPGISAESGDFSIVDMGILTVRCPNVELLRVLGTPANVGDYTHSAVIGETVELEAPAREGKLDFAGWFGASGRLLSDRPQYSFAFTGDTTVVAGYEYNGPTTHYYVNDEIAEDDWAPGHDDNDGLSPSHPKRHIVSLLDGDADMGWGAVIHVGAGTYPENVILTSDHIGLEMVGADKGLSTIDGNQQGPCLTLGTDIGNDYESFKTGRISRLRFSNGTLGVLCNEAGRWGGALSCEDGFAGVLSNSIFWLNAGGQAGHEIALRENTHVSLAYCNIAQDTRSLFIDSSTLDLLDGNATLDPCFAAPGRWVSAEAEDDPDAVVWISGDYHLQSRAGRWDPSARAWVIDSISSPCIDAGDPNASVGLEIPPNGGVVNMGVYGGTDQAGKSIWQ